jgi:hypothetical protein
VVLRSIDAIIADLSKPIADRHRTHKQAGKDITYLPWYFATERYGPESRNPINVFAIS